MPRRDAIDSELHTPRFERFRNIQRLGADRSGHASVEHVRHQLYVARDTQSRANVLIKLTTKPGLVYQRTLTNEIETLTTINRELPDSRVFPVLWDHGTLPDGRAFLVMSLFDEWPLATTIGPERRPERLVAHVRTALAVAEALGDLHRLQIFHVDLNPMNILFRWEGDSPIIRIIDFESAYEVARHAAGVFYSPPTTSGFSAPEVAGSRPDARADVYSLGAVLYTMIAGYDWSFASELGPTVAADGEVDPDLKAILVRAAAREPERRYASMQALQDPLRAYLESIWPGRSWQAAAHPDERR
jgi:serine/threonine protein kinase